MTSAARHSEKMNRTKGNKTTIIPQVLEKTTTKSFYSWSVISFRAPCASQTMLHAVYMKPTSDGELSIGLNTFTYCITASTKLST
jgi:hypothetical protein